MDKHIVNVPIRVAARPMGSVCSSLLVGIDVSNPAEGFDVLTLDDGTDRLSQKVRRKIQLQAAL